MLISLSRKKMIFHMQRGENRFRSTLGVISRHGKNVKMSTKKNSNNRNQGVGLKSVNWFFRFFISQTSLSKIKERKCDTLSIVKKKKKHSIIITGQKIEYTFFLLSANKFPYIVPKKSFHNEDSSLFVLALPI